MTKEQKARKNERCKAYYHQRMASMSDDEKKDLIKKRRAYYLKHRSEFIAYQTARRLGTTPKNIREEETFINNLERAVSTLKEIYLLFRKIPRIKPSFKLLIQRVEAHAEHRRKRLELIQEEL